MAPLPEGWARHVNQPQTEGELEHIGRSVRRGCPYGTAGWVVQTAAQLGLESTLRPHGRPPKSPKTNGDQMLLFEKD